MTPWPLELSTPLPPKTSTALVLFSSAFFLIQSLVQVPHTASILSNTEDAKALLRKAKQAIIKQDNGLRLQVGAKHQSVKLALNINWLRVWETARDKGPY